MQPDESAEIVKPNRDGPGRQGDQDLRHRFQANHALEMHFSRVSKRAEIAQRHAGRNQREQLQRPRQMGNPEQDGQRFGSGQKNECANQTDHQLHRMFGVHELRIAAVF